MSQIQLDDFKMHYIERGAGADVIIFVHGFISTHRWWLPTFERLADNFHAYAIDIRAAGESEQIETGHTLAQYAEDLHQFVQAQKIEKFTLVGHSMGGAIAMEYAIHHQDHLNVLVLVDPAASSGTKIDQATTDWINSVQGQREGQQMIVLGAFSTAPTGGYLEQLVTDAVGWDKPIYLGSMADMATFNVTDKLNTLAIPTLVTWGDKDAVIPFHTIAETFTNIEGAALEVWHGVGHSGPIEIPDRFVALLTQFVSEASQPEAS
jgi:pimeloyl-ACP methyl ester carboxylesterase